jgi:hypothetical protein
MIYHTHRLGLRTTIPPHFSQQTYLSWLLSYGSGLLPSTKNSKWSLILLQRPVPRPPDRVAPRRRNVGEEMGTSDLYRSQPGHSQLLCTAYCRTLTVATLVFACSQSLIPSESHVQVVRIGTFHHGTVSRNGPRSSALSASPSTPWYDTVVCRANAPSSTLLVRIHRPTNLHPDLSCYE